MVSNASGETSRRYALFYSADEQAKFYDAKWRGVRDKRFGPF